MSLRKSIGLFMSFAISITSICQVTPSNNNVSEIIAPHKSPAAFLEGLIPLSKKHLATIVDVLPTGSFLK